MNETKFGPLKRLKLKFQLFGPLFSIYTDGSTKQFSRAAELVPSKKLGPPSLSFENLKSVRKVLLNYAEYIEI